MALLTAAILAASQAAAKTSLDFYLDLQRTLAKHKSVTFVGVPTTGNNWDHELAYGFKRPGKAYVRGYSNNWRTNGRWTYEDDDNGGLDRAYRDGDMARVALPGWESFHSPKVKAQNAGEPVFGVMGEPDSLALRLKLDGKPMTVFYNMSAGLPKGYSIGIESKEPSFVYGDVKLDARIDDSKFYPPKRKRLG